MAIVIEPPPTYALPIIGNPDKIKELNAQFNPLWLKWFIDLTAAINATGGSGIGTVTNVGVSAGTGITASVTDPTTTPVINIALSGSVGTVTTASVVTANGVSGTVANASTTPAITLTLAAITPTTVTPSSLVDISGAAAGQIKFPATQNASANVNTLDDYEEGTWTPVANSFTIVGTPIYAGTYTKVGRLVFCRLTISAAALNTIASTGGTSYFSGMPFAPARDSAGSIANASLAVSGAVYVNSTGIYTPTFGAISNEANIAFCYEQV